MTCRYDRMFRNQEKRSMESEDEKEGPIEVDVQAQVLSVLDVHLKENRFEADIQLSFSWSDPDLIQNISKDAWKEKPAEVELCFYLWLFVHDACLWIS